MCDRVVDPSLLALKFVPDWFVTNKMIKKLDSTVFSDNYLVFGDSDSDYCDPKTINHARLMAWYDKYKQCKASKK